MSFGSLTTVVTFFFLSYIYEVSIYCVINFLKLFIVVITFQHIIFLNTFFFNVEVFQPPSEKVTIPLLEIGYQTYLSRRNLTALTSVENSISITVFFFRSSQIITEISERTDEHTTTQAPLKGTLDQSPDQAEMLLSLPGLNPTPQDSSAPSPPVSTHSPAHTFTGACSPL